MRPAGLVICVVIGCAHSSPSAPAAPSSAAPAGTGDWLRLVHSVGGVTHGEASVLIEQDVIGRQTEAGGARHVALEFRFFAEEKVLSAQPSGEAELQVKLQGVVIKGSEALDAKVLSQVAAQLEKVVVRLELSARGQARVLDVDGLAPPLDEKTVRSVVEAIYLTPHAPVLPTERVELHARWQEQVHLPAALGVQGEMELAFHYDKREGQVVTLLCDGEHASKKGAGAASRRVVEKVHAVYELDVGKGEWVSRTIEQTRQIEETMAQPKPMSVGVRQHVRAKWTR